MTSPTPQRPSLSSIASLAVGLGVMAAAAYWFAQRWQAVAAGDSALPVSWGWVAVSVGLLCVHAATAFVVWHRVLGAAQAPLPWGTSLDAFVPSLLARYVPGRVWAHSLRIALARRAGVKVSRTTGALVMEIGLSLGSAAVVATLALYGTLERERWWIVAAVGVGSLLLLAGLKLARRLPPGTGATLAISVLGWLAFGAAHLAVAASVAAVNVSHLPLMTGATALAWAIGYLAIVVPMGFGVRDAALVVVLTSMLDPAAALRFVAIARLAQLLADVAITATWWIAHRRRERALPSA